jgi:predicted nucleic acid-binding protein
MPKHVSERVRKALESGHYSPWAAGMAAVGFWRHEVRQGRGDHHFLDVLAGDRLVQIVVSPNGRVVRVYVDGECVHLAMVARIRGSRRRARR